MNAIILSRVPQLTELISEQAPGKVCLHLGCGGVRWENFINVDLFDYDETVPDTSRTGCVADAVGDMRNLGLQNSSIDEIFSAHTLEHFTRWEAIDMITDWHRMLKPGAKMVLETPDFTRCLLWLFHPSKRKRNAARRMFYGNQWNRIDFETHRYVWSASEIKKVLNEIGFSKTRVSHSTWTHFKGRDMRITSWK